MPVKRRVHKARPSIAAALPHFQHALRARAKWRHTRSEVDREAAHEAERVVERMLGWRMWEISIWDFDDIYYDRSKPPQDPRDRDDWAYALELREALEQADREQRRARQASPSPSPEQPLPEPSTPAA
jgi:hypothetical protein